MTTTKPLRATAATRRRAARLYNDVCSHARTRTSFVGAIDAEDVAHTMALAILTGTRTRHDGAALTFGYRRAIDKLRAEMRAQGRIALAIEESTDDGIALPDTTWSADRSDAAIDTRDFVGRLERVLPEWGGRMLRYLAQDLSAGEIAAAEHTTVGNVYVRLSRLRTTAAELAA